MGEFKFPRGPIVRVSLLDNGEAAWANDTGALYIGGPAGNVQIANKSEVDTLEVQSTANTKKVKGFINIAEYGAIGDGVTDDQTPIVNAVADAKLQGYVINWGWDGKTYLTTANIPDFHKVKHIGNAIVKRGTDLFYISPQGTQRNKLYVSVTGGSTTFDGLSASQSVPRVQTAFTWLENYGPILTGFWELVLTTGTFIHRAVLKDGLLSENPIEVNGVSVGGHPSVPTTIISEGLGASAVGIFISGGSKLKVTSVKLTGFNGTASSAGLKASNASEITTSNVHFTDCYWGISSEGRSKVVAPDGIFDTCGYLNGGGGTGAGIRSLQLNNHVIGIQNNAVRTNTAIFRNCYQAALLQESSTGHMDWVTIEDCEQGIVVRVNARANVDGTLFQRNGKDMQIDANGHAYVTANNSFAAAGVDESDVKVMTSGGGNITSSAIIDGVELSYGTVEKSIVISAPNTTIQTTTDTTFHTALLKAPLWRNIVTNTSLPKKLYFKLYGTLNGTLGTKTIKMFLGGVVVSAVFTAAETGPFQAEGYVYFTGTAAQTLVLKAVRNAGTDTKVSKTSNTLVMTSDVSFDLKASVGNVADSVVIDIFEFGLAG